MTLTERSILKNRPLLSAVLIMLGAGLTGFTLLLAFRQDARAWQIYLVNFLFWSAIAQGGLLFSMIMHVTRARWSGGLQNLSEAFVAFFPVSFLLFLGLFAGKEYLFPWLGQDLHGKEVWLNLPFLFTRDTIGLVVLYGLGFFYVLHAMKLKVDPGAPGGFVRRIMTRMMGKTGDTEKIKARMTTVSVLYMLAYAGVLTLISVDLVMSMDPHWISTLFGGYFFIKAFYIGLGGLIILASLVYLIHEENSLLNSEQFHDAGKLFFGFCIVWAYFLYAQVMMIWYGNMPEETHFLIQRYHFTFWKLVLVIAFVTAFVLPFFTLLNEKAKKKPVMMLTICSLALAGIWADNLLLVGPSLNFDTDALILRIFDVLISLGFMGLMAGAVSCLLKIFPELFLKTEEKVG